MSDMIQAGADWLTAQLQSHVGVTIAYVRGSATCSLVATPGATEFTSESESGVEVRFETRDYIFPAADLVLNGAATLPRRGDKVQQSLGEEIKEYQVFSPSGEQFFRFTDPGQKQIRIHTQQVGIG